MRDDKYISIHLAGLLEGKTPSEMKKRITTKDSKYIVEYRISSVGSDPIAFVKLSSLNRAAREKYRDREDFSHLAENEEMPWYLLVEYTWYEKSFSHNIEQGLKKLAAVEYFIDMGRGRNLALKMCSHLGVSIRYFYLLVTTYEEALKWKLLIEKSTKVSKDKVLLLALCTKPRNDIGKIKKPVK